MNLKIKETELNSTILSHLEMSNDLVDAVKTDWNAKGIFKRICLLYTSDAADD